MLWDPQLLLNAIVSGLLLGGFYAVVTVGVSISFGMLDIVNIAHPAFIMLGSYLAYLLNSTFGLDPILSSLIMLPAFFLLGALVYQIYYVAFERRGQESLRGLAFFFGLLFITEVLLILAYGVDYRYVSAAYIDQNLEFKFTASKPGSLPGQLPCSFLGRAIAAVSQDPLALRLMAANPTRVKRIAFALSIATASIAGSLLIVIQPVEPSMARDYIGRVFAICVLGGMGSFPGTLLGAVLLGVVESITSTFYGPSWSPAVAFGFLLLTLAFRPAGILGR